MEQIVAEGDPPVGAELDHPDWERAGELHQHLLSDPDLFMGCHLVGDVDHLAEHVSEFGIAEMVGIGELDPPVRLVGAPVPTSPSVPAAGVGEHLQPVVDRSMLVVRVDELQRALADDVGRFPPEHLGGGRVDRGDHGHVALQDRTKPGPMFLVRRWFDRTKRPRVRDGNEHDEAHTEARGQVEHVHHDRLIVFRQAHRHPCGTHRPGSIPRLYQQCQVSGDDKFERGRRREHRMPGHGKFGGHRHELRRRVHRAHRRVDMLGEQLPRHILDRGRVKRCLDRHDLLIGHHHVDSRE